MLEKIENLLSILNCSAWIICHEDGEYYIGYEDGSRITDADDLIDSLQWCVDKIEQLRKEVKN